MGKRPWCEVTEVAVSSLIVYNDSRKVVLQFHHAKSLVKSLFFPGNVIEFVLPVSIFFELSYLGPIT